MNRRKKKMFDHLYEEAYKKLKNEICSMAGRILIDVNAIHNSDYVGKLRALNEVFDIINKVDDELYNALLCEVKKEAAYYEAERVANNSSHENK